jgi:hypothetical protein
MATNFEVRVLLALWDLGGVEVSQSKLNQCFSGRTADVKRACASLMEAGAIAATVKRKLSVWTLTDAGKGLLQESLAGDGFLFKAQIGAKMANAVLKWWRSQPSGGAMVADKVKTIESYEAFKSVALDTYDRLNRDFNLDDLVPIYRIRREIGDRVSRDSFNTWLLKMQTEKILRLQGGSVEDSAPDKIEDSITTEVSGLRCFATRL